MLLCFISGGSVSRSDSEMEMEDVRWDEEISLRASDQNYNMQ